MRAEERRGRALLDLELEDSRHADMIRRQAEECAEMHQEDLATRELIRREKARSAELRTMKIEDDLSRERTARERYVVRLLCPPGCTGALIRCHQIRDHWRLERSGTPLNVRFRCTARDGSQCMLDRVCHSLSSFDTPGVSCSSSRSEVIKTGGVSFFFISRTVKQSIGNDVPPAYLFPASSDSICRAITFICISPSVSQM